MKYYKYIDLDFANVAEKIKILITNNPNIIKSFWTTMNSQLILYAFPEIQKMFDPLKINVRTVSLVSVTTFSNTSGIHRDYSDRDVRINIPIINCEGSKTNFYKSEYAPTKLFLPNNVPYYQIDYDKCTIVDSFCLNKPAAIRVTELHQVVANPFHLPRISCTVDFKENIDYIIND